MTPIKITPAELRDMPLGPPGPCVQHAYRGRRDLWLSHWTIRPDGSIVGDLVARHIDAAYYYRMLIAAGEWAAIVKKIEDIGWSRDCFREILIVTLKEPV